MPGTAKAFPKFKTILYFFAVTEKGKFPGQIEIYGDDDENFATNFNEVMTEIVGANPDENAVTYEPREVSAPFKNSTGVAAKPKVAPPAGDAPQCPIHLTEMRFRQPGISQKTGKPYPGFYSCAEKNEDGTYCNRKPA